MRETRDGNGDDVRSAGGATGTLAVRSVFGGVLMGLANLVPGISGGTMLLAVGIYPQFIGAVADATTFRFRARTLLVLGGVVGAAAVAIISLAGPVSGLVVHHRWIMYSLFIGLTLGGVPVVWRLLRPIDARAVVAAVVGVGLMAMMAFWPPGPMAGQGGGGSGWAMSFVAGVAGASAMVLPGVSGGYLLLVLGQYVTILTAVDTARAGVSAGDWALVGESMHVIVPVALGVLVGVVGISNLIRLLLDRFRRPTLGLLLGLLLGAVLGLYPFQEPVAPAAGDVVRGEVVELIDGVPASARTGEPIAPEDFPTEFFGPSPVQVLGAAGLVLAGVLASMAVALVGRDEE